MRMLVDLVRPPTELSSLGSQKPSFVRTGLRMNPKYGVSTGSVDSARRKNDRASVAT